MRLTSYGIPDEAKAREIGQRLLDAGLVKKVTLNHIVKVTQRGRWSKSSAVMR